MLGSHFGRVPVTAIIIVPRTDIFLTLRSRGTEMKTRKLLRERISIPISNARGKQACRDTSTGSQACNVSHLHQHYIVSAFNSQELIQAVRRILTEALLLRMESRIRERSCCDFAVCSLEPFSIQNHRAC